MIFKLKEFNFRHLYRTRRYLMTSVFLGVTSVGLVLGVMLPTWNTSWSLQQEFGKERQRLEQLQKKQKALTQGETLSLNNEAERINKLLPSQKPLLDLMMGLNVQAEKSGVTFENIQISPGKISTESAETQAAPAAARRRTTKNAAPAPSAAESLSLSLTIQGKLTQINSFFAAVEKMAPLTNVTGISLTESRSGATSQEDSFEAELQITTYYFTKSIAATLEAPLPALDRPQLELLESLDDFEYTPLNAETTIRGGGSLDLFGIEDL